MTRTPKFKLVDDFEYEAIDGNIRTVLRIANDDFSSVSIEKFWMDEAKPLDDRDEFDDAMDAMDKAGMGRDRDEPYADILIEAETAVAMGGIFAKLGREALRRYREESQ